MLKNMKRLITVNKEEDILEAYRNTPIGQLLESHNLQRSLKDYQEAKLLVGMCMDRRKSLHIPDNFAFVLRTGGANLQYSEFKVSYAIAVGGVTHIAIIGHTNCGMLNIASRKDQFIEGLVSKAGWDRENAEQHFLEHEPKFEISNEVDFVLSETKRLRTRYPKITIAPMIYKVEDNKLYLIEEESVF